MPTWETADSFWRDWKKLDPAQRDLYLAAVAMFVDDLRKNGGFRKGLRVKPVQGKKGVWEMTWSMGEYDGRATFSFGEEVTEGEQHVIWRRIGGHDIFKEA